MVGNYPVSPGRFPVPVQFTCIVHEHVVPNDVQTAPFDLVILHHCPPLCLSETAKALAAPLHATRSQRHAGSRPLRLGEFASVFAIENVPN